MRGYSTNLWVELFFLLYILKIHIPDPTMNATHISKIFISVQSIWAISVCFGSSSKNHRHDITGAHRILPCPRLTSKASVVSQSLRRSWSWNPEPQSLPRNPAPPPVLVSSNTRGIWCKLEAVLQSGRRNPGRPETFGKTSWHVSWVPNGQISSGL